MKISSAEYIKSAAYQIGRKAIKDLDEQARKFQKQESPNQKAGASQAEKRK